MTFYGKTTEADTPPKDRNFAYRIYDGGVEQHITAHQIYFYEHGRVGFWNDAPDGERVLVLATKAFQVREVVG